MLSRWFARKRAARGAVAGLAVGVTALAGLTAWSTATTQHTTTRVRAFNEVSGVWEQLLERLTAEDAILRQFLATDRTDPHRPPLHTVIGSAKPMLDWLETHGETTDVEQAQRLRAPYATYTKTLRSLLNATYAKESIGDYFQQALTSFTPLRQQVVGTAQRRQYDLTVYLASVDQRSRTLRWIGLGLMAVDAMLLLGCSLMLVGYQRRAEQDASTSRHRALHDALTGLANRDLLKKHCEQAVAQASATDGLAGLLLFDLDRFKEINDTLGHHCGDIVLQRLSERLTEASRDTDMVARLGGDEFAILLPRISAVSDVKEVAHRLREILSQPVDVAGLKLSVSASVGVAVYPADCDDAAGLLRHADVAMYVAKRNQAGVSVYDEADDGNSVSCLALLGELRQGIERGELVLHYQPKVDATSLVPCGVEALVRWRHPQRGLLYPDKFIPLCEESELIEELTTDVLRQGLRQIRSWSDEGRQLTLAVNIPARCLVNEDFSGRVAALLAEYGVPADLLTLELTESALITYPERAMRVLQQLRAHGIRLSIDDFGTGYSSLDYLRKMPMHELKIDRSFVTTMCSDTRNQAIVNAVVDLGRNLSCQVVAEGVEDDQALAALAALGCHYVQGYFVSKPLTAEDLTSWLDRPDSHHRQSPQRCEVTF